MRIYGIDVTKGQDNWYWETSCCKWLYTSGKLYKVYCGVELVVSFLTLTLEEAIMWSLGYTSGYNKGKTFTEPIGHDEENE